MSYPNRARFILLIISFLFSCNPNKKKDDSHSTKMVIDFVASEIGEYEYWKIYGMMCDSISSWEKNELRSWKIDKSTVEFQVDSVLCINKKLDKVIAAHLGRQLLSSGTLDGIAYLYGVKIKGQWYFFSGPTLYVPRDKENLRTPTSFTKLHEIAMDNIFKGYLKKNKESGEWEINEGFFADLTGNAGCADCKTQAQWDSTYLATVRENWKNRDTTNYQPLQ